MLTGPPPKFHGTRDNLAVRLRTDIFDRRSGGSEMFGNFLRKICLLCQNHIGVEAHAGKVLHLTKFQGRPLQLLHHRVNRLSSRTDGQLVRRHRIPWCIRDSRRYLRCEIIVPEHHLAVLGAAVRRRGLVDDQSFPEAPQITLRPTGLLFDIHRYFQLMPESGRPRRVGAAPQLFRRGLGRAGSRRFPSPGVGVPGHRAGARLGETPRWVCREAADDRAVRPEDLVRPRCWCRVGAGCTGHRHGRGG